MHSGHPKLLGFFCLAAVLSLACYGVAVWRKDANSKTKPHIVFIVADDMGWNDVSFHGSNQIPTPNIDALAYNGVILNRHYTLPMCTPSRSALLTGRYAIREGTQGFALGAGVPDGLPLNTTLMPKYFKRLGYKTHLLGKWHLGFYTKDHTPVHRGFDTFYGYYNGFISYFGQWYGELYAIPKDSEPVVGRDLHRDTAEDLTIPGKDPRYFTDVITDEAVKIIRANGNEDPLLLEISHLAPHTGDSLVEPQEVRDVAENDKIFSYIENERRRTYAGMMKALDDSVGRVMTALADTKMLENSIVIFMSDNGGATSELFANAASNYPLRGMKDTSYEGGVRGVACVFSPLINSRARVSEQMMHITDWLPTLWSAAGGNLTDLKEIDGLDQWPTILDADVKSPREKTLIDLDDIRGFESAIIGRFKLVRGARNSCQHCYGDSGDDPSYRAYQAEEVLSSPTGRAINRLGYSHRVSEVEVEQMREKSTVRCKPSTLASMNCTATCLFDIIEDPCETKDIQNEHPEVVESLVEMLEEYRGVLKPKAKKDFDPCSEPSRFNGSWMPWLSEELQPEARLPNECQRPDYTNEL